MASTSKRRSSFVESNVPARLDRLLWGNWHTLVDLALGITWLLDGLEVTLANNATVWLVAALGSEASVFLLQSGYFDPDLAWRLAFLIGALLGLVTLLFRNRIPESPRWLLTRGRVEEADTIVRRIERSL